MPLDEASGKAKQQFRLSRVNAKCEVKQVFYTLKVESVFLAASVGAKGSGKTRIEGGWLDGMWSM